VTDDIRFSRIEIAVRSRHRLDGPPDSAMRDLPAAHRMRGLADRNELITIRMRMHAARALHRIHRPTPAAIVAGIVAAQGLIFAANGFRCPLTDRTERLAAE
jgi:hypothetical protein